MRFFKDMKFWKKVTLICGIPLLLISMLIGAMSYTRAKDTARSSSKLSLYDAVNRMDISLTTRSRQIISSVEAIAEGKSVVDGVGQYIVTVRGSFLGENAQFDATKHSLGVSYTPGQLLRDQLKAVKVICNGLAQTGPVINSITDSVTKSISQVITSGGPAVISGSNIKILGDDPSVGIYLTKDEEGAVPLKVSVIVHNAPSQLTIMLPAIEAGKLYALSITTQYSGSNKALKTPRSYRFPILLGDENAGGGGGGGEAPDPEIPGGGEAPDPAA